MLSLCLSADIWYYGLRQIIQGFGFPTATISGTYSVEWGQFFLRL